MLDEASLPQGFLIDLYDTAVSCDFDAHYREMPALAGLPEADWSDGFARYHGLLFDGTWSMGDFYRTLLVESGRDAPPELVDRLVQRDAEIMVDEVRLNDDAVELLAWLRERAVPTALVSNCANNTRAMVEAHGLHKLVDVVVLSCEVGSAKPDPGIFHTALRALDVPAEGTMFADDSPMYCLGAAALGIRTACIRRNGDAPDPSPTWVSGGPDLPVELVSDNRHRIVRSLTELLPG
jgi:putative hydrolase of the HAD superfamily